MRTISYNAPVTLTFTLVCTLVAVLDLLVPGRPFSSLLALNRGIADPLGAMKAVTYVFAHADWAHFTGNLTLILLLGPQLEARYGPGRLVLMIAVTAVVSGALSLVLFHHGIMGASGIVFLFVVLSSFTGESRGRIPLTFLLVAILFLSGEVLLALRPDNISRFAHLAGGAFGAFFGFTSRR